LLPKLLVKRRLTRAQGVAQQKGAKQWFKCRAYLPIVAPARAIFEFGAELQRPLFLWPEGCCDDFIAKERDNKGRFSLEEVERTVGERGHGFTHPKQIKTEDHLFTNF